MIPRAGQRLLSRFSALPARHRDGAIVLASFVLALSFGGGLFALLGEGRRMAAMVLSGALAGLAGTLLVMGDHGRFLSGISPGYTWTGMILAMMVCYPPLGAVAAAFPYAAMSSGALEMELLTDVPGEVVEIIMTSAVLFVTTGLSLANRFANRMRED